MTEIYDDLGLNKASRLDNRLEPVATFGNLLDPNLADNFLFEGTEVYVIDEKAFYYREETVTPGVYAWVLSSTPDLVIGNINILATTSTLDMSAVVPAIAECYAVNINIVGGGSSATIQSITNFPGSDKLLTFHVTAGQQVSFVHNNYSVATTDQVVLELGFDMTLNGRTIGSETLTLKKHDVALCQWDATQFMNASEWAQNLLSMTVIDDLLSTDGTVSLSANQGRILNNLIATKQDVLTFGNFLSLTGSTLDVVAPPMLLTPGGSIPLLANRQTYLTTNSFVSAAYNFVSFNETILYGLSVGEDSTNLANWKLLVGEAVVTGVDHTSLTSGTGAPGTTDTYTLWADVGETISLGTFDIYQGMDAPSVNLDFLFRTTVDTEVDFDAMPIEYKIQLVDDYTPGNYDLGNTWATSVWLADANSAGKDIEFNASLLWDLTENPAGLKTLFVDLVHERGGVEVVMATQEIFPGGAWVVTDQNWIYFLNVNLITAGHGSVVAGDTVYLKVSANNFVTEVTLKNGSNMYNVEI